MDPSAEYTKRLEDRRRWLVESQRKTRFVATLRLSAGLLSFLFVYLVLALHQFSGWFILLPVATYIGLVIFSMSVYPKEQRALRAVRFYEIGLARIQGEWVGNGNPGISFADSSSLYVNDLDIFGVGSVFELLCTARTQAGQETLARWLSAPASSVEIRRRQAAVEELRNNVDLREDLAILGREMRATVQPEIISNWATAPILLESSVARIIAPILVALTMGTFAYAWFYGGPLLLLLLSILAHGGFGSLYRARVRRIKSSFEAHAREFTILQTTLERLEREKVSSPLLQELRGEFGSASTKMKTLVGFITMLEQQRNEFVMFFAFFLLWSTQISFAVEQWRKRHGSEMDRWLRAVGEMEALCALASFAFERPQYPFPEIVEGSTVLEAEDVRHPLLLREKCVPNTIKLGGDLQLLVISGSNMSGKSTLLRTVGTNVVLALAGAPVSAERMKLSPLAIGATLRVQDSLLGGTSRFYAEIQRLRDIMELTEKALPVLLLLDEILYGTNSHDRTIGAEAVIRGLVEKGAVGFVTTHDLALAKVADALAPKAANAHFEDRLEDGKMIFDYMLRPGVVQRSNALALMRAVGLKV
jgi:MutS-like protein